MKSQDDAPLSTAERTMFAILQDPEFRREMRELKKEILARPPDNRPWIITDKEYAMRVKLKKTVVGYKKLSDIKRRRWR